MLHITLEPKNQGVSLLAAILPLDTLQSFDDIP